MKHFVKRRDIIITTADKDDVVVILDTENYTKEAYLQLSDKNNYKALQTDPTLQDNKMVNDTLHRFENENLLSKKVAWGLKVINPKTPKFYITPITQKENNPGRPVINSINCHTSEISPFVENHSQHLVSEIPSYIKDTNDFVNKINHSKVWEKLL